VAVRTGDDRDGVRSSGPERPSAAEVIAEAMRDARPRDLPDRLCGAAVRLLPVIGASVSLCGEGMPVRISASNAQSARIAELQATLGDGPCLDAARTGTAVLAADLTTGKDTRRWPVFALAATAAGVRATYSMPLGDQGMTVGTLDLYRSAPGLLTVAQLRHAVLVAGVMTVAVTGLQREAVDRGGPWLGGLARDQDKVFQATGVIMAQLGIGADEALTRLRGRAFAQGRTALEVARDVVAHRERLEGG
jgi:hypothetical protein